MTKSPLAWKVKSYTKGIPDGKSKKKSNGAFGTACPVARRTSLARRLSILTGPGGMFVICYFCFLHSYLALSLM